MKLHSNPASPFGRKVKVVAHETGLFAASAIHNVQTTAVGPDLGLVADNPLGQNSLPGAATTAARCTIRG